MSGHSPSSSPATAGRANSAAVTSVSAPPTKNGIRTVVACATTPPSATLTVPAAAPSHRNAPFDATEQVLRDEPLAQRDRDDVPDGDRRPEREVDDRAQPRLAGCAERHVACPEHEVRQDDGLPQTHCVDDAVAEQPTRGSADGGHADQDRERIGPDAQLVDGVLHEDALTEQQTEVGDREHGGERAQRAMAPEPSEPGGEAGRLGGAGRRVDGVAAQHDRPDQHRGERERRRVHTERQPDRDVVEQRADREPHDAPGDQFGRHEHTVGASEGRAADDPGQERLGGAVEHHLAHAHHEEHGEECPHSDPRSGRTRGDQTEQDGPHDVGEDHQAAAVVAVDGHPDGKGQHHPRHERGGGGQREHPLVVGEREHQQRHGDEVDAVADVADEARRPLAPERPGQGRARDGHGRSFRISLRRSLPRVVRGSSSTSTRRCGAWNAGRASFTWARNAESDGGIDGSSGTTIAVTA